MSNVWGCSGTVQFVNRLHCAFFMLSVDILHFFFLCVQFVLSVNYNFFFFYILTRKLNISFVSLLTSLFYFLQSQKLVTRQLRIFGLNLGTKASNISRKAVPESTEC